MFKFVKINWYWLLPLAVGLLGYGYYYYITQKDVQGDSPDISNLNKSIVLYNGINGYTAEIMYLQTWLNNKGGQLTIDGVFGPLTASELHKQTGKWDIKLSDLPK